MPVIPWSEWRPDVSDYQGNHSQLIKNVVPRADGYGPFKDFAALTNTLPAACRGYAVALDDDGSVVIFAGTATKLYKLDNSDFTWDNVSKSSGAFDYAVPSTDQWQFAQFGTNLVATNSANPVQVFALGSSSNFADLGGSPPQAKYVAVVNVYLVLSGLASNPFRVQWSANGDITGWTSGTNQAGQQDFPDGGIVRSSVGDDFGGLVFQDNAIRRMVLSPGSPIVFAFDRISEDHGLGAPLSLIRSRGRVFFLGLSGFYEMQASGGDPQPIGKERFDRTFFADWDDSAPQLMIGANDPNETRVMWAYKSVNGASDAFDRIILYDWVLKRATLIDGISGQYITSLAQPGQTLEGLDTPFPNLDTDVPVSLDEFQIAFARKVSIAGSTNSIGFFSGDELEATLETPERSGEYRHSFIRAHRPLTDASNVVGAVGSRERIQDPRVWSAESALEPIGEIPHRVETRLFRFRNRIPAGEDWTFSIGVEPDIVPTGAR